jgi:4-carboxymuconolactone decarboxylase
MSDQNESEKMARGLEVLSRLHPSGNEKLHELLDPIAPGVADAMVSWAFGDVYARPGLELRDRQLVSVVTLAALGGADQQLAAHFGFAMQVGISREELREAIIQIAPNAGVPKMTNALLVLREVEDPDV